MNETKTVYVAYTNTDCTEGRGTDIPIAVCAIESTAIRLARGQYVQGSNGPVRKMELVKINDQWYAPSNIIKIINPTREDEITQKKLETKYEIIEKAKEAGLTDDEIKVLMGWVNNSSP